jgi:hypothetical protein
LVIEGNDLDGAYVYIAYYDLLNLDSEEWIERSSAKQIGKFKKSEIQQFSNSSLFFSLTSCL